MTTIGEFAAPEHELHLYDGESHFDLLAKEIAATNAGDRVAILTMSFDPSEAPVKAVLAEAQDAAERNVDVNLLVDAYTLMVRPSKLSAGPLWSPVSIRAGDTYEQQQRALDELAESGVKCTVLNKPANYFSHPFAGRSHIKGSVVNDSWRIGGANLHDTERADLFVGSDDGPVADVLYDSAQSLAHTENTIETFQATDVSYAIDDKTQLLIDAGVPGQSAILEEACAIIDAADRGEPVLFTSQYFPKGTILQKLIRAHERRADVHIIRNFSTGRGLEAIRETLAMAVVKKCIPPQFYQDVIAEDDRKSHIKSLATGSAGLVTSHNFDPLGVRLGTAEIAVVRHTEEFAKAVGDMMLKTTAMSQSIDLLD